MIRFLTACLLAFLLATSLSAKEKVNNQKLTVGEYTHIYNPSVGEKKPWYINDHCFIQGDDGVWHMYGITHEEPFNALDELHFAHATAKKLMQKPWDKQPFALSVAKEEPWKEKHLWAPHVIRHDGLYYMFYCAGGESNFKYKLHLATSPDLKQWTRHKANPLVVDGFDARDPCVFRHKDQWIMYYTATRPVEEGNHVVIAVTSKDLLHWGDPKVAFKHPRVGKWGGPTESPYVFKRKGKFYLSTCTMPPYDNTTFFESDNPYHWDIKDSVGATDAHCAEVIQTKDGKWYVSRAGWGKKGVYLAEMTWLE